VVVFGQKLDSSALAFGAALAAASAVAAAASPSAADVAVGDEEGTAATEADFAPPPPPLPDASPVAADDGAPSAADAPVAVAVAPSAVAVAGLGKDEVASCAAAEVAMQAADRAVQAVAEVGGAFRVHVCFPNFLHVMFRNDLFLFFFLSSITIVLLRPFSLFNFKARNAIESYVLTMRQAPHHQKHGDKVGWLGSCCVLVPLMKPAKKSSNKQTNKQAPTHPFYVWSVFACLLLHSKTGQGPRCIKRSVG
jgi:hypothetical protein